MVKKLMRQVGAALPPEVAKELDYLIRKGYTISEIIREGIRRFAEEKRKTARGR